MTFNKTLIFKTITKVLDFTRVASQTMAPSLRHHQQIHMNTLAAYQSRAKQHLATLFDLDRGQLRSIAQPRCCVWSTFTLSSARTARNADSARC